MKDYYVVGSSMDQRLQLECYVGTSPPELSPLPLANLAIDELGAEESLETIIQRLTPQDLGTFMD